MSYMYGSEVGPTQRLLRDCATDDDDSGGKITHLKVNHPFVFQSHGLE